MNIEEAREKLELMEYKYTLTNNDDKAIETVLNELHKKDKEIDEAYKEGLKKGSLPQILENWNNEHARIVKIKGQNEIKDAVIDMIVNTIVGDKKILALFCKHIINKTETECDNQNLLCDDCIKEYFYNKAQENNN